MAPRLLFPHCRFSRPCILGGDVLAFIGWQHAHEHRPLVEVQRELNPRGVVVNERNVGKLYRKFLALLAGLNDHKRRRLAAAVEAHGGLVRAIAALQPEERDVLLYVVYEALSGAPVGAIQTNRLTAAPQQVVAPGVPVRVAQTYQ